MDKATSTCFSRIHTPCACSWPSASQRPMPSSTLPISLAVPQCPPLRCTRARTWTRCACSEARGKRQEAEAAQYDMANGRGGCLNKNGRHVKLKAGKEFILYSLLDLRAHVEGFAASYPPPCQVYCRSANIAAMALNPGQKT